MDSYQPGDGSTFLQKVATNQDGVPKGYKRYDQVSIDPNTGKATTWQNLQALPGDTFMDKNGWMLPIALVGAGAALGGTGGAAAGTTAGTGTTAGAGTAGTAASSAIPTAAELEAAGFGTGGMGMTGAGGIGSASSVAGAGAGAAGYGTTAAELGGAYAGAMGDDQLANEWQKLVSQNAADSGTLLPTNLPTVDLSAAVPTGISDALKSVLTPSNIAKVASALKGGASGGNSGGVGLNFGNSLVPNQAANMTPGMIAASNSPQTQQQQLAQALILGDSQPKFSQVQFNPLKFAQALQDDNYG
jgi:hypothetical protein